MTGSGAQTFPLKHLLHRKTQRLFVKQPHGLAFRTLSELGMTGFLLMSAFIALTMGYITLGLCSEKDRWE